MAGERMLNNAKAALVIRVDELVRRGRRLGEDAQPAERIDPLVDGQHTVGNRRTADAVEAVAPGNQVAVDLAMRAAVLKADHGSRRVERGHRHPLRFEVERPRGGQTRLDQISNDFVLAVDGDRLAAGQFGEVDAMPRPVAADIEAIVTQAVALKASPDAHRDQQIHGALLQHACPHAVDDVLAAAILDDDRVDAVEVQQVPKQQARRPRANDAYLRSEG
jgi:hypothetical protein